MNKSAEATALRAEDRGNILRRYPVNKTKSQLRWGLLYIEDMETPDYKNYFFLKNKHLNSYLLPPAPALSNIDKKLKLVVTLSAFDPLKM